MAEEERNKLNYIFMLNMHTICSAGNVPRHCTIFYLFCSNGGVSMLLCNRVPYFWKFTYPVSMSTVEGVRSGVNLETAGNEREARSNTEKRESIKNKRGQERGRRRSADRPVDFPISPQEFSMKYDSSNQRSRTGTAHFYYISLTLQQTCHNL